jgi:hypothetical protein
MCRLIMMSNGETIPEARGRDELPIASLLREQRQKRVA